ncbi:CAP domain-containing protein [Streptomyces phaeolivaceus]|uniref:CAP domain-containing protein n=1 Tax=Streptomyces phaeolivaceus TaxID=2653200 RepID=A0A5P8K671_9ACTN|nr:CAP domain-containing protein [Streptomyces phaeolivaceus]QFQ98823.1 CAP domain-containing protein [Streptomyces phaeolivaceus]
MSRSNSHRRKTKGSETTRSETTRSGARRPGTARARTRRRKTAVAGAVLLMVGAVGIPTVALAGGVGLGDLSGVASSWWGGDKADTVAAREPSRTPTPTATEASASASPTPSRKKRPSRSASPSASPSKSGSPAAKSTPEAADTPDRTTSTPVAPKATKAARSDTTAPAASDDDTDSGPTARVLTLVNAEREKAGCSPVTVDTKLTKAARDHSQDMADHQNMSHTGSDGSSMTDRLARVGYRFSTAGENVAAGYGTADSVMDGWMNSPGHKANILNCAFKEIGIGLAGPGNYWTQNFGSPA